MHPVLILTHNCLELTKKCVESVRRQSIDTHIHILDNGSTDGTREWIEQRWCAPDYQFTWTTPDLNTPVNKGVSWGWNNVLSQFFDPQAVPQADYVLVLNNDTIIPRDFYSDLLCCDVSFVSGTETQDMKEVGPLFHCDRKPLVVAPDFSAFLIRREAWEKVGPFDERMKLYASDNDWAVRAHRAGVPLYRANVPFYHERSSTLKNASPEEKRAIQLQADADREVFKSIYGVMPWEQGYAELFK